MELPRDIRKMLQFVPTLREHAKLSPDRRRKVAAYAFDDNLNIVASGYNGFPRRVNDKVEERYHRPAKYSWTCHAEENTVANAAYMGVSLRGTTLMVIELTPCDVCARMTIQAGIARIVCPPIDNDRWAESNSVALEMYEEAGLEVFFSDELLRE